MNWDGKKLLFFDIETTGLSAIENKFICSATTSLEKNISIINKTLKELYETFQKLDKTKHILVTYCGENYYHSFDFPFLRTKFILNGFEWVFKDWEHLDLYPLIRKYLNAKFTEVIPPSQSTIKNKTALLELCQLNSIEYTTVKDTYRKLQEFSEVNWGDYQKEELKDKKDLQTIYQMLYDPDKKEEYIEGSDAPQLYQEGKIEDIVRHNINDTHRLEKVTNKVIYYFPDWEIERNINLL